MKIDDKVWTPKHACITWKDFAGRLVFVLSFNPHKQKQQQQQQSRNEDQNQKLDKNLEIRRWTPTIIVVRSKWSTSTSKELCFFYSICKTRLQSLWMIQTTSCTESLSKHLQKNKKTETLKSLYSSLSFDCFSSAYHFFSHTDLCCKSMFIYHVKR